MASPPILPGKTLNVSNLNSRSIFLFLKNKLQVLSLTVLAGIVLVFAFYLEQMQEEGGYPAYYVAVLWVLTLIFFLWLGNLLIYLLIRRRFSWESSFNLRFFLQVLLSLIYSLFCINATYLLFKNHYTELPPNHNQYILLNIYGLLFLIPVLSIQFGLLFLQKWKKAILEQEKLKQEQVHSELISLRSHLSPHFLFNNLNILSSLIQVENYAAQDYLDRFAEVYRYVLKNRDVELIPLKEELDFLESYNFLLHQRFSDGLQIRIQVQNSVMKYLLPPLALQMVLENALKHNKLSEKQPLKITVFTQDTPQLMVQNNLQIRDIPEHEKTGFGLENIRRRYWLIARKEIDITETSTTFTVALPLIKPNEHGHFNH